MLLGHIVLALPLRKADLRDLMLLRILAQLRHEFIANRLHQCRGGKLMTAMAAEEIHHPVRVLQLRHVHVQVHPVDALHLQAHFRAQYLGYRMRYSHGGLRSSSASRPPTASAVNTLGARLSHPVLGRSPLRRATTTLHLVGLRRSLVGMKRVIGLPATTARAPSKKRGFCWELAASAAGYVHVPRAALERMGFMLSGAAAHGWETRYFLRNSSSSCARDAAAGSAADGATGSAASLPNSASSSLRALTAAPLTG
jgi:hypothetical protein